MKHHISSIRILSAGPNNYRWRSYCERLEEAGFISQLAGSGIECMAAIRAFLPHVVVLDPNIPWGGGDGILAVREEEPELKNNLVMILLSHCEMDLLYRLSNYAIDDLVEHQISAASLQRRLEHLLRFQHEAVSTSE